MFFLWNGLLYHECIEIWRIQGKVNEGELPSLNCKDCEKNQLNDTIVFPFLCSKA